MLYRKHPRQAPSFFCAFSRPRALGAFAISGCSSGPAGRPRLHVAGDQPGCERRSDGSDGPVPDAGDSGVPLLTGSVTMLPDGGDGGFHVISGIVIPPPVDGGDLDDACDGVMPRMGRWGQVLLDRPGNPDPGVITAAWSCPPTPATMHHNAPLPLRTNSR